MSFGKIYIYQLPHANDPNATIPSWKKAQEMRYTKYDIKETDFRVKTASFTSPQYLDLTTGQYAILISSPFHENFSGLILDNDYDEDKGLYTYQCQDWSRRYMGIVDVVAPNCKFYNLLMNRISHGATNMVKPTAREKRNVKKTISGLRKLSLYDQSLYKGNLYKGNWFNKNVSVIMRGKTEIEAIRSLVYSQLGYYDVYFNDKGILQIEPLSKRDWENTGLVLSSGGYHDRKFKFSTTNAITTVTLEGSGATAGSIIHPTQLDLSAFFGIVDASISNQQNTTKNTTKAVTTNKSKTTKDSPNKYGNPFMNKPKKAWINADNGSGGFKSALAKRLRKDGWSVHESGTGPNTHYSDYSSVSKNHVMITIYNGFCAGTVREQYSSKIQSKLKSKGVVTVVMFDTRTWTDPHGMKPYRYGDFKGARIKRAHDDNFSSGDPTIPDAEKFFKQNKAYYCAGPSISDVMKHFNAGGYFAYKGIKV